MENITQSALEIVIEETNWAYHAAQQHESMNADYADFAGMALLDFKNALRCPELTREELETMLRSGMHRYRSLAPEDGWTTLMAGYMERTANSNPKTRP
ncbi:MAG: hypothetical protein KDI13_08620 [Alphaproteobacteria bacterium]|nr:hypothetical protein [Alphaproteobacteria bacterium]